MFLIRKHRPPVALVVVALAFLAGCGSDRVDGDEWGDPGRPGKPTSFVLLDGGGDGARDGGTSGGADGARADGATTTRLPDAQVIGARPDAGAVTAADTAAPAPPGACDVCEAQACRATLDKGDLVASCYVDDPQNPRKIGKGPRPTQLFTAACKAVVDCVRMTKCAGPPDVDPARCYCGPDPGPGCLAPGAASGACKSAIEAAVGSTDPTVVVPALYDLAIDGATGRAGNAAGVALNLIVCDNFFCSPPCLGYNACLADSSDGLGMGNPLCDTAACKTGGQCLPHPLCVESGFCAAGGDGGAEVDASSAVDGAGPSLPDVGAAPDQASSAPVTPDAPIAAGDGGFSWVPTPACTACEQMNILPEGQGTGFCLPDSGCDKLPAGPDRDLCDRALLCMRRTACWRGDRGTFYECYCGAASDTACAMAGMASGACKAEFEAAARSQDPLKIGSIIFTTDPALIVPLSYAGKLASCDHDNCLAECSVNGAGASAPDGGTVPDAAVDAGPDAPVDARADGSVPDAAADGAVDGAADAAMVPDATATADAPVVECPDLDGDGQLDCRQTLVLNPGFTSGAGDWRAEYTAAQVADGRDGNANAGSGSLAVTNGNFAAGLNTQTMAGASQCIAAIGGASYGVIAQAFIPPSQGTGGAGVDLRFFDSADCSGASDGPDALTPLTFETGAWKTVRVAARAPTGARSIAVRLVVQKPYNQPTLTVLFDNVLVRRP